MAYSERLKNLIFVGGGGVSVLRHFVGISVPNPYDFFTDPDLDSTHPTQIVNKHNFLIHHITDSKFS